MAHLDQVLSLALDRRQARQGAVDVGHDECRHEPRARRADGLDRGLVGQPRMLDRRDVGGRRPADQFAVLSMAHHATTVLARGRNDRPKLIEGQFGCAVDHDAGSEPRGSEHRRLGRDDLHDVGAARDDLLGRLGKTRRPLRLEPERGAMTSPREPTAVPATMRRGPGVWPAAMASRSTHSRLRIDPAPRAEVIPARSARAAWALADSRISSSLRAEIACSEPSLGSNV